MALGIYFGQLLKDAVEIGLVSIKDIDDKVLRILTAMYTIGAFDTPSPGNIENNVTSVAHNLIARQLAEEAIVLLQNNGILPLDPASKQVIAVLGTGAAAGVITGGGGSGSVIPYYKVRPLDAIVTRLTGTSSPLPENVVYGDENDLPDAIKKAQNADVAIVFLSMASHEGQDRPNLSFPPLQEQLANGVVNIQKNTIFVLTTPGACLTPFSTTAAASLVLWMPGYARGWVGREKERKKETDREKEREKERDRDRDRDREKEREKERDRDRDRDREKERDRDRD